MAGWNGMMEFSSNPLIVFVRWGFSDSCFRVLYQSKDGEPVLSPKHGGEGGDPTNLVNKYIIIITITMSLFKYEKKICNYNSETLYKDVSIPCMHVTLIC